MDEKSEKNKSNVLTLEDCYSELSIQSVQMQSSIANILTDEKEKDSESNNSNFDFSSDDSSESDLESTSSIYGKSCKKNKQKEVIEK